MVELLKPNLLSLQMRTKAPWWSDLPKALEAAGDGGRCFWNSFLCFLLSESREQRHVVYSAWHSLNRVLLTRTADLSEGLAPSQPSQYGSVSLRLDAPEVSAALHLSTVNSTSSRGAGFLPTCFCSVAPPLMALSQLGPNPLESGRCSVVEGKSRGPGIRDLDSSPAFFTS